MRRSAKESLLSAILLGAMLAASAPVAADEVTDSSITPWVNALDPPDGMLEPAAFIRDIVLPAQNAVRSAADQLEKKLPVALCPLPLYRDLLFNKHSGESIR